MTNTEDYWKDNEFVEEVHEYRKRPCVIEAIKWTGNNFDSIKEFAGDNVRIENDELIVVTLEDGKQGQAKHAASIGDFIIKGIQGEFYFCKADIFEKSYEYHYLE